MNFNLYGPCSRGELDNVKKLINNGCDPTDGIEPSAYYG
jgi:uncharacterized protein YwgA